MWKSRFLYHIFPPLKFLKMPVITEAHMADVTLPWNKTKSGGILFPIGNMFNLRMTCVLKDLKSLAVSSISDCSTQKFKSTSFTYTCIKSKSY